VVRGMGTTAILLALAGLVLGVLGLAGLARGRPVVGTVLVLAGLLAGPTAIVVLRGT
jgi:hypothetical protein